MVPSWLQILVVVALVVVLFGGRGKISGVMGDLAKGIKAFKTNIKDDEAADKLEKTDTPVAGQASETVSNEDSAAKS